jgi:hypothetical protein
MADPYITTKQVGVGFPEKNLPAIACLANSSTFEQICKTYVGPYVCINSSTFEQMSNLMYRELPLCLELNEL